MLVSNNLPLTRYFSSVSFCPEPCSRSRSFWIMVFWTRGRGGG